MTPNTSPHITAEKFESLQLLRFIAAFMVIILHSTYYTSERLTIGSNLYDEGANGVALFFVISGFVMVVSSQKLMNERNGWKIFSVKRLIRIVPIYWLIMGLKIIMMLFSKSMVLHANLDIPFIIKSHFFIPAINVDGLYMPFYGVGWTLNFEIFFYSLFALCLLFRLRPLLWLSAIFIPLFILSFFDKPEWGVLSFYADPIIINFIFGMVAADLVLKGIKIKPLASFILILISTLYLFIPRDGMFSFIGMNIYLKIVAAFLTVYCAASLPFRITNAIPKMLIYFGGASYSLYLIHPFLAPAGPMILKKIGIYSTSLSVLTSVVIAMIGGVIFFKICEVPLTRIGSRLTKKISWMKS